MKAYDYYERAYNEFKNQRKNYKKNGIKNKPSIEDLYYLNQKLLSELNEKNLLNSKIMKQFNEIERDFIINRGFKIHWKETPKIIDEHLLLNSQIIENKKKLITIKKDSEKNLQTLYLLEFEEGVRQK